MTFRFNVLQRQNKARFNALYLVLATDVQLIKTTNMDKYQNLKGKLFKRNKYGLSEWTQKVERIVVVHNMNSNEPYEVLIFGNGQNIIPYSISEIEFVE